MDDDHRREERPGRGAWRFGAFELDGRTLELRRDGRPVPLEPLPARILVHLVASAGELVSRERLRASGWPRLPGVADDSLNTCIRQIRTALGDDASSPRFVETLRGRGYRFRCPVEEVGGPGAARPVEPGVAAAERVGAEPVMSACRATVRPVAVRRAALRAAAAGALLVLGGGHVRPAPAEAPAAVRAELAKVRYLAERGDLAGALARAETAARSFPDRPEFHGARAEALVLLGRVGDAWAAFAAARSLDPADPRALRAGVLLHALDRRWDRATALADQAVAVEPDRSDPRVVRAYVRALRGDRSGALADLERAVAIDPLSPVVRHDAGQIHLWAGRWDAAREACETAAELAARPGWALGCAFDAAVLAGRTERAAEVGARILAGAAGGEDAAPGAAGGSDPPDAAATPGATPPEAPATTVARVWQARERTARRRGDDYGLAVALAARERTEEAVAALMRAVDAAGFSVLAAGVDPRLASLRGHPRFRTVLARLGLEGVEARS